MKQTIIEPIETIILDGDETLKHFRALGYSILTLNCLIVSLIFGHILLFFVILSEYENAFPFFLIWIISSIVYCLYLSYSMKRDFKRLLHE